MLANSIFPGMRRRCDGFIVNYSRSSSRSLSEVVTPKYDEYWMPFTHNRSFKNADKPKMFHKASGYDDFLMLCMSSSVN